ncbi:hypothetical protein RA28_20980 [Ruegeria sp. ANG-S4]|uniref:hypothetical protein n=1 Tax=Ruegeria sp. ANG-S4 TaxID=1577904 RepID=UPI00057FD2AE|nr:hypothetical protein [Ruegeria sp. ANG-S4]KIC41353.1 hypothetical protein RA28_20980 [Ruegeria sp. ANG-S4]
MPGVIAVYGTGIDEALAGGDIAKLLEVTAAATSEDADWLGASPDDILPKLVALRDALSKRQGELNASIVSLSEIIGSIKP